MDRQLAASPSTLPFSGRCHQHHPCSKQQAAAAAAAAAAASSSGSSSSSSSSSTTSTIHPTPRLVALPLLLPLLVLLVFPTPSLSFLLPSSSSLSYTRRSPSRGTIPHIRATSAPLRVVRFGGQHHHQDSRDLSDYRGMPPGNSSSTSGGGDGGSSSMGGGSGGGAGRRRPLVIGITGGIASGKSAVAKLCQTHQGAAVIDADVLGHRSYAKGTDCFRLLVKTFGDDIVGEDGNINRRALGSIVFSSSAERKRLEGIVWPEIRRLMELDIQALGETGIQTAVVEAAVMLEAGWEDAMDELWVVVVDPEIARTRLMARNNLSSEDASRRIEAQMTNEERVRKADRVIHNNKTAAELDKEVELAWTERGTLRRRKAALRARWRIFATAVGFALLASLVGVRVRAG